jgi:hypothetical protein
VTWEIVWSRVGTSHRARGVKIRGPNRRVRARAGEPGPCQGCYEEILRFMSASMMRWSIIDSTLSRSWRSASLCPVSCLSRAC